MKPNLRKIPLIAAITAMNLAIAVAVHFSWAGPGAAAALKPVIPPAPTEEERTIQVIAKTSPAVVSILIQKFEPSISVTLGPGGEQSATDTLREVARGTGFLVSSDGMIVTNRHVARDRRAKYSVFLQDERQFDAKVLDIDPVNDLALLKIDGQGFPKLELAANDDPRIGQTVIAIGNALGKYTNTVTRGILSGVNRSLDANDDLNGGQEHLEDVLQTDAAINAGNSGGPLLNLQGKVIGVSTAIEQGAHGLGFAIPTSEVRKILDSYSKFRSIARPRFGVRYIAVTPDVVVQEKLNYNYGALVKSTQDGLPAVVPNTPAAAAGIREGDIILEVNGIALKGKETLTKAIQNFKVGDVIRLKIARGGEIFEVSASLEAYPPFGL